VTALQTYIEDNTTHHSKEIYEALQQMVSLEGDPIALTQEDLLEALTLGGEFLLLKLHYSDFEQELKSQKIKYKISQSLAVVVSYEDDGSSYEAIETFVKYMHSFYDTKQHCIFGVKKVEKLSEFPVKILFSGIFPINQLHMGLGEKIYELIHSDDEYFKPRFEALREELSCEIGLPILPLFPYLDKSLDAFDVKLVDPLDERTVCEFRVCEALTKESLEIYLMKLFYHYKILAEEKNIKHLYTKLTQ
jgi:hypothetical protein